MFELQLPAVLTQTGTADPVLMLLIALVFDLFLGTLIGTTGAGPTALFARLVAGLAPRLDRTRRSRKTRLLRGALLVLFVVAVFVAAGLALVHVLRTLPGGWILEILFMAALIGQGGALRAVRAAARADHADAHAAPREASEMLARAFLDHAVAPVFWFLVLGVPGLVAYRALSVTAGLVGDWRAEADFGWPPARAFDAVGLLPGILSGALLAVASVFAPGARPLKSLKFMAGQAAAYASFAHGWPVAAVAGAFGIVLGGPRPGPREGTPLAAANLVRRQDTPWLGAADGRSRLVAADFRRVMMLYGAALLLTLLLVLWAAIIGAAGLPRI